MEDSEYLETNFSVLRKSMEKLTDDGKIRKKITRKGIGLTPPPTAIVSVLYTTYSNYYRQPLDITYKQKSFKFQLDNTLLIGLNYAVLSMQTNEMSIFYIHKDYPFGKIFSSDKDDYTWVMIELLNFSDTRLDSIYDKITTTEIKLLPSAKNLTLVLMANAKYLMSKNMSIAMREYQKAYKMLNKVRLKNDYERNEQKKLKIKILTNLVICFNKNKLPKKACILCNEIYKLAYYPFIPLPAKIYFNHGRALYLYGNYKASLKKLLRAQRLEPNNHSISEEVSRAGLKVAEETQKEKKLTRIYIDSESHVTKQNTRISCLDKSEDRCILCQYTLKEIFKMLKTDNTEHTKIITFGNIDDDEFLHISNVARHFGFHIIKDEEKQLVYISK